MMGRRDFIESVAAGAPTPDKELSVWSMLGGAIRELALSAEERTKASFLGPIG